MDAKPNLCYERESSYFNATKLLEGVFFSIQIGDLLTASVQFTGESFHHVTSSLPRHSMFLWTSRGDDRVVISAYEPKRYGAFLNAGGEQLAVRYFGGGRVIDRG